MTMKRWLGLICLSVALSSGGSLVSAAQKSLKPQDELRKIFPKLKYTSFTKTEITGLYEVIADGRIVYFYPKTGYLFVGEIYTKDGRNLTQERVLGERYRLLTNEDLKKAIKVGTGKNIVVEVTDPDCPYCRKMHAYWNSRKDLTRYIFFKPLDMHPDAVKKVTYILAADDTEKALFEVYSGQLDGNRKILDQKHDDKGLLKAQKAITDKLQVNATPSYWVNGKYVSGANIPLVEKYLGKVR
ncbi:MAG: DsbC family protein [Deltaproteobacteria bacterium]|nr:DsbC family protein [Deltaproteobacteria bacterium]TLN05164.1 MAG: DsbC family protein [bacterium]